MTDINKAWMDGEMDPIPPEVMDFIERSAAVSRAEHAISRATAKPGPDCPSILTIMQLFENGSKEYDAHFGTCAACCHLLEDIAEAHVRASHTQPIDQKEEN